MRILVASDAWHPQVNGVVRTYERLAVDLGALGVEMTVLAPHEFRTLPCPTYPEIRLALPGLRRVAQRFRTLKPDAVHIATEGPIGWMARRYCRAHGIRFTTSFHTRFPEYLSQRFAIPTGWTLALLRRFHRAGAGLMVATPSLARELESHGFERVLPWTRGVDTGLFRPRPVRLFGARAFIPEGPIRLAQLSGAPLVAVFCARLGFRRYRIEVNEPIFVPRRVDEAGIDAYAQQIAGALEAFLRRHPTQWFDFGAAGSTFAEGSTAGS